MAPAVLVPFWLVRVMLPVIPRGNIGGATGIVIKDGAAGSDGTAALVVEIEPSAMFCYHWSWVARVTILCHWRR